MQALKTNYVDGGATSDWEQFLLLNLRIACVTSQWEQVKGKQKFSITLKHIVFSKKRGNKYGFHKLY